MPHRWSDAAEIRRLQIESGLDLTFCEVFLPLFINKIQSLSSRRALEIGAGTGHLAKAVQALGIDVTAIEPSPGMHAVAADVLADTQVRLINCSSNELDQSLKFDVVYSHMVAHVVEDLHDFYASAAVHLGSGGHFIFSVPHPCFYNDYKNYFGEEYRYIEPMKKTISFTITKDPTNPITDIPYHHRPLSIYINELLAVGLALDGFDEVYPGPGVEAQYGAPWLVPRYCVFVCRKL